MRNVLKSVYPTAIVETVVACILMWLLMYLDAMPSIVMCALSVFSICVYRMCVSLCNTVRIDWKKILDHVYDAAVCGFSFIDIFCDVAVTVQFWVSGHMKFFWISMFILFLAQIAYAGMITFSLDPIMTTNIQSMDWNQQQKWRTKKGVILFIVALPFGQLVPLYLMAVNAFPTEFDRIHKYFGYKSILSDVQRNLFCADDKRSSLKDDEEDLIQSDPLSLYIRHKLMSHLGFLIEAIIEAYVCSLQCFAREVIHLVVARRVS